MDGDDFKVALVSLVLQQKKRKREDGVCVCSWGRWNAASAATHVIFQTNCRKSVRWCFNISASSSSGDVHTAVAEVNAEFCFLHKHIIFHSICTNLPKFYFTESILRP
uniref:Uncharacterized protein n=1 Tax=Anguilla anguilla TaxID=7936 RepID=A0A0E9WW09_ANGAN